MSFVCPWENPSYRPGPTTFQPAAGHHQHGTGDAGSEGIVCGHCGRCQTCGGLVLPELAPEPDIELRLGGRAPGLYVDGVRLP